jgi:hypothetical protein
MYTPGWADIKAGETIESLDDPTLSSRTKRRLAREACNGYIHTIIYMTRGTLPLNDESTQLILWKNLGIFGKQTAMDYSSLLSDPINSNLTLEAENRMKLIIDRMQRFFRSWNSRNPRPRPNTLV